MVRLRTPLVLPALLLLGLAPLASACSIAMPQDNRDVAWADDTRALTNRGTRYGWQPLQGGAFDDLVEPFLLSGPQVRPDGAWVAWQEAGLGADCSPQQGVVKALGPDGAVQTVAAESAASLSAGPAHLAVALHGRPLVRLYEWGRWDAPREVAVEGERAGAMAASPDGRWFAVGMLSQKRVVLIDAAQARAAGTLDVGTDVAGIAFSPDGTRLAVLDLTYGVRARLRTYLLPDLAPEAERAFEGIEYATLAWGPGALAVVTNQATRVGDGNVAWNATAHLLAPLDISTQRAQPLGDARVEGRIAFTPQGRLVYGMDGALRVSDEEGPREVGPPARKLPSPPVALLLAGILLVATTAGVRRAQR